MMRRLVITKVTSSYNCGGIEEFTEGSVSNMYSTKRFIAWATLDGSRDDVSNLEIQGVPFQFFTFPKLTTLKLHFRP